MDKVLSEDTALEQFEIIEEYYDLEEPQDKDQKVAYNAIKGKLLKAIQKGRITINVEGGLKITQNLVGKYGDMEPFLIYGELSGRAKKVMSKTSDNDHHGKIYLLLGALTGYGAKLIEELKGVDHVVAESLGLLFLMV